MFPKKTPVKDYVFKELKGKLILSYSVKQMADQITGTYTRLADAGRIRNWLEVAAGYVSPISLAHAQGVRVHATARSSARRTALHSRARRTALHSRARRTALHSRARRHHVSVAAPAHETA